MAQKLGRDIDAALQHEGDGIREHIGVKRLRYEASGTQLQYPHDIGLINNAGQNKYLERGIRLDQFFEKACRRLYTRQIQVENQQVCVLAVFSYQSSGVFGRAAGQYLSSFKLCFQKDGKSLDN